MPPALKSSSSTASRIAIYRVCASRGEPLANEFPTIVPPMDLRGTAFRQAARSRALPAISKAWGDEVQRDRAGPASIIRPFSVGLCYGGRVISDYLRPMLRASRASPSSMRSIKSIRADRRQT